MKGKGLLIAIVVILLLALFGSCDSDPAAGIDYGKGYYYNSQTKTVEKNLWGITHNVP